MEARLDLHSHQLLKQEFASVRDLDLADLLLRIATSAVVLQLFEVGFAEKTTLLTNVDTVRVRHVIETFFQETSSTVRDHAVSLHFTETQATVTRPTFCRLSSEDLRWPSAS